MLVADSIIIATATGIVVVTGKELVVVMIDKLFGKKKDEKMVNGNGNGNGTVVAIAAAVEQAKISATLEHHTSLLERLDTSNGEIRDGIRELVTIQRNRR